MSMSTLRKFLLLVLLIQCIAFIESARPLKEKDDDRGDNTFNVVNFGATGDGLKDDSKAFKRAWDAACGSSASSPTVLVPQGKTFMLQPIDFDGECNSNPTVFQIDGKIISPGKPSAWECKTNCHHWIGFKNIDGLFIQGSGTINGQGSQWWNLSCKDKQNSCQLHKPTGFRIENSKNVEIKGLTFEDSPKMHIAFEDSTLIHATDLRIKAPEDSPNTDGIHIQRSTYITIDNSIIQTGDDCISMGDGSKHIEINSIECGPGHGISIGSLGINGKTEEVEFVHVKNITFHGTTNGVRIKTWQVTGSITHANNIIFGFHENENFFFFNQIFHLVSTKSSILCNAIRINGYDGSNLRCDHKLIVQPRPYSSNLSPTKATSLPFRMPFSSSSLSPTKTTSNFMFRQGGSGYARNIKFEHITSYGSTRPIVIDQYYCPHKKCKNQKSAVEISNVSYQNINGTSHNEIAVQLECSESTPCKGITMKDINLTNEDEDHETSSSCLNVQGLKNGRVHPNIPCLEEDDSF